MTQNDWVLWRNLIPWEIYMLFRRISDIATRSSLLWSAHVQKQSLGFCGIIILKNYSFDFASRYKYIRHILWWRHQWNIFRVTGPLWEESAGHQCITLTKASDEELWSFLWSAPEKKTAEKAIETSVIWDIIALILTSLLCPSNFECLSRFWQVYYHDVMVTQIASQITSLMLV